MGCAGSPRFGGMAKGRLRPSRFTVFPSRTRCARPVARCDAQGPLKAGGSMTVKHAAGGGMRGSEIASALMVRTSFDRPRPEVQCATQPFVPRWPLPSAPQRYVRSPTLALGLCVGLQRSQHVLPGRGLRGRGRMRATSQRQQQGFGPMGLAEGCLDVSQGGARRWRRDWSDGLRGPLQRLERDGGGGARLRPRGVERGLLRAFSRKDEQAEAASVTYS